MSAYIESRWGDDVDVTWYSGTGSGLNFERPELLRLIADVLAGRYKNGYIIATDFTRICRFGIAMIQEIARIGECEIVYTLQGDDEKTLNEELSEEILSILTHYTAKASGNKAKLILAVKVPEDVLRDAFQWYRSGLSYRGIADKLIQQGRGTDVTGKPITHQIVRKRLVESGNVLEKLYGSEKRELNSFEQFCSLFVRQAKSDKSRLSRTRLMDVYEVWCENEGCTPLSGIKVAGFVKAMGWTRKYNGRGNVVYQGVSLNTNKA